MISLFVILIVIAIYPYIIYPLLGGIFVLFKKVIIRKKHFDSNGFPDVTLLITAYNEENIIDQKVKNIFELEYPVEKLHICWVTDGSTDQTPDLIADYPKFKLLHNTERLGKVHAMQRAIAEIDTPIIVCCDANTFLNSKSIMYIVEAFKNPKIGCVAGEKRVITDIADKAATAGEGLYWKYESIIKKIDSNISTAVGAVGELFAFRKELFESVSDDTILDDFLITMKIAAKGYKIAYEPKAVASEYGSANVKEEMKRKIRIASGCFQVSAKNPWIFNFFKHPFLTFQFVSHKFMRWVTTPLSLLLLLPLNIYLVIIYPVPLITVFLFTQLVLYFIAFIGYILQNKNIRVKAFFIPYYFLVTNVAQFIGFYRFIKRQSTVKWERAKRIVK